jgi:tetratricopeptide (TPR) repeat protein
MKKNETIEEHRVIENAISEFGLESIKVAEMFRRLDSIYVVSVVAQGDDSEPMARLDMPINEKVRLERPTALAHYLFADPALVSERVTQVETAFAFALPRWAQEDPEALDSAIGILHNLCVYHEHGGTFEEWEPFSERILEMFKIKLGHNHTAVMNHRLYIGAYYFRSDELDEADKCFKEAAAILETHPELKITESPKHHLNSAGIFYKQGRWALALCALDEVMNTLKQAPTMDKVVLLQALVGYATVFHATDNLEEFDRVSIQAEETARETWESDPTWTITSILLLIRSNEELGRLKIAEKTLKWLVTAMESLADREGPSMGSHEAWVHFLNDCRLNGLPMSAEKMIPELVAQLSNDSSGYVH